MTHDYKEGPYSTGTLIERLEEMCGCGEEWGVLAGRDVWPDDVLEAIQRIKQLEAALHNVITAWDFWQKTKDSNSFTELFVRICEAKEMEGMQ